jgi:hypothetical protein
MDRFQDGNGRLTVVLSEAKPSCRSCTRTYPPPRAAPGGEQVPFPGAPFLTSIFHIS